MERHLSSVNQAFTSTLCTNFNSSHRRIHTLVSPSTFLRPTEFAASPTRRARNGACHIRLSADGSSEPPDSSPIPPPSPSSASDAFSSEKLLEDLRDDGGKRQSLALVTLTRLPPQLALRLLTESGVLRSRFRKPRIAALNALGTLKLVSQSAYLADVLQNDPDYSIRAAAAGALSYILDESDLPQTSFEQNGEAGSNGNVTGNANIETRVKVNDLVDTTEEKGLELAARTLRKAATEDEHFIVRYSSIVALGTLRDVASVDLLLPLVQTFGTPTLEAAAAIDALGEILRPKDVSSKVLSAVRARATDTDDLIRAAVARTFDAWRAIPEAAENLLAMLRNEVKFGRSSFVLSLLRTLIARGGNA